jgi:AcrR family transcriptional regulator
MATTQMSGEALAGEERALLAAVLADWSALDYVTVRAVVVAAADADERVARLTAMGREFVAEARRCARYDGVAALLAAAPNAHERILENATRQLVAAGRDRLTMQRVSRDTGIPRRTLYHLYSGSELAAACRRRAQTVWRAHFEHGVLAASTDPKRRLFAVIEALDAWAGSARFRADQVLCARASFGDRPRDDDLRVHLAEIERFATRLATAARLAAPDAFGAFVATSVAGAAAWFDRRASARAAGIDVVERALARR